MTAVTTPVEKTPEKTTEKSTGRVFNATLQGKAWTVKMPEGNPVTLKEFRLLIRSIKVEYRKNYRIYSRQRRAKTLTSSGKVS